MFFKKELAAGVLIHRHTDGTTRPTPTAAQQHRALHTHPLHRPGTAAPRTAVHVPPFAAPAPAQAQARPIKPDQATPGFTSARCRAGCQTSASLPPPAPQ